MTNHKEPRHEAIRVFMRPEIDDSLPPPCQSPTCDMNLSACVCGSPFGDGKGATQ